MKRIIFLLALFALTAASIAAQATAVPRESQKQTITQSLGDSTMVITYSRPNVKGRKIWGALVPYGKVWRAGANESTVFEIDRDAAINGQKLPAGKYSVHMVPGESEWIVAFNTDAAQWGSFTYDEKKDALRVAVKPLASPMAETLVYEVTDVGPAVAQVVLKWEKIAVPFTVDVGDVSARVVEKLRSEIKDRKPNEVAPLNRAAAYVAAYKLKANYEEALQWLETSLTAGESFANLSTKARILNDQGKTAEAVALGEKAVKAGRSVTPPVNKDLVNSFEETVNSWKK